jgi:DNA-binding NarL/FixJ family response regulator
VPAECSHCRHISPWPTGIELIKIMKAELPKLPILVLSMYDEDRYALRALRAGASGYLTKSEASGEVLRALRKILKGGIYVSPEFSEQVLRQSIQTAEEGSDSSGGSRGENWKSSSCLDGDWE